LTIGSIDKCPDILAPLFIPFKIKSSTLLCWLADDHNPQKQSASSLEETVSNFKIAKKLIFSIAE